MNHTICIFTTRWGAHFGGINVFNREMCIGIKQFSSTIKLICVVEELSSSETNDAKDKNIELIEIKKNTYPIEIINKLSKKEIFPTVWIGHDIKTGQLAIDCSKLTISFSAVISHFDYDFYGSYKGNSGTYVEEKMKEQKKVLNDAQFRFAVGPKLHRTIKRLTSKSSTALNPGCFNTKEYPPSELYNGFFVMSSGRLGLSDDNIKRVSIVMKAFEKISKNIYLDKMLTIVGIEKSQIENITKKNTKNILNIKALEFSSNRSDIFQTLSKQTVFIMPSLHEGFGLTGLEAISMEVPLIITSNSGLHDMLSEYKLLDYVVVINMTGDNKKDTEELYNAMERVFQNKDEHKNNAIVLKEKLNSKTSWKQIGESVLKTIDKYKLERYFPVKSLEELENFKKSNIFKSLSKNSQYLFTDYSKILDHNNGTLEKKYGYILYQAIAEYQNYINVQKELASSKKNAEDKLKNKSVQLEELINALRKLIKEINFASLLELAEYADFDDLLSTTKEIQRKKDENNIYHIEFLKDIISELSDLKSLLNELIERARNENANQEAYDESDIGQGYISPEAHWAEGIDIDSYNDIVTEIIQIENILNSIENIEDMEKIENGIKELKEEIKELEENSIFTLEKLILYLNNKKTNNQKEQIYLKYCLLICNKLKEYIK